jgi:hypothetical protein
MGGRICHDTPRNRLTDGLYRVTPAAALKMIISGFKRQWG